MSCFKKITSIISSAIIVTSGTAMYYNKLNSSIYAEQSTVHTITFYDYNKEPFYTLNVADGEKIDYSKVNTEILHSHIDTYTEIRFASWNIKPEIANKDLDIYALYEIRELSLKTMPEKTEYFSKKGNINLKGLKVIITSTKQISEIGENGDVIINNDVEITDITSTCYTKPANLSEAFADGDSNMINLYPIDTDDDPDNNLPLASYEITYFPDLGDINGDKTVDALDATFALSYYAAQSLGQSVNLTDEQKKRADTDRNGIINVIDATNMLIYYSRSATSNSADWEVILSK